MFDIPDLRTYPNSSIGEINQRIGLEIVLRKVKLEIDKMIDNQEIIAK